MKKLSFLSLMLICTNLFSQKNITVENPSNYNQINNPVTLGVPFERGTLFSLSNLEVQDNLNISIPAQFSIMANWEDGSIKWVKTHFQANVNSNSNAQYNLVLNGNNPISSGIVANETNSFIEINTGSLKFKINKQSYNLLDSAWVDFNNNSIYELTEQILNSSSNTGFLTEDSQQNIFKSNNNLPDTIYIEEQGPLVTVVKIEGKHYDNNSTSFFLKYETRIYAYANKPFIKIRHSYANGNSVTSLGDSNNPNFGEDVEEYSLNLNFNMVGQKSVQIGGDLGTPLSSNISVGDYFSVIQQDRATTSIPFSYSVDQMSGNLATGNRADGWMGMADQSFGVLMSGKYFWEKYPKEIRSDYNNNLTYKFIPDNTTEFLWAGQGSGDELLLYFYLANEYSLNAERANSLSKKPLYAYVDSGEYTSSNVFYDLPECNTQLTNFNTYISTITSNHISNRDALDLYGNSNFGDVPREQWDVAPDRNLSVWGNNYYDATLTNAKLFALTGGRNHLNIMEPMVWHWMETACWNTYDKNDWMNGYCPAYSDNHRGIGHYQHHYGEGVWYYYYLTGDERAREIGMRAANSIKNQQIWGGNNVTLRESYQRGSACLEAFKATRDTSYLGYTKRVVDDLIMTYQNQYGLIGSYDNDNNAINGEQTFMMALYSDVLWKYIQESGDTSLVSNLTSLADFVNQYARVSVGQENYYNFWDSPTLAGVPSPIIFGNSDDYVYWNGLSLIAGLYAYAYDLSGNPIYQNLANNTLNAVWGAQYGNNMGIEFYGKAAGEALKNVHHTIAILENCLSTTTLDNKTDLLNKISIYPNPGQNNLFVNSNVNIKKYQIMNQLGQIVNSEKVNGKYKSVDVSNLVEGVYLIRITMDNSSQQTFKWIKN